MSELLPILSPILGPVTSKLTDRGSGNPYTVTVAGDFSTTSISSATFYPVTSASVDHNIVAPDSTYTRNSHNVYVPNFSPQINGAWATTALSFNTDASKVEFEMMFARPTGQFLRDFYLEIDGIRANVPLIDVRSGNIVRIAKVIVAGPTRMRTWRMTTKIQDMSGFYVGPGVTVTAATARPQFLAIGDSYLQSASAWAQSFGMGMAQRMGYTPILLGVGGTGYAAIGSTYTNYLDRLAMIPSTEATGATLVGVFGGINDTDGASIASNAATLFANIRTRWPSAVILATGPWCPKGSYATSGKYPGIRDAIKTALAGVSGPWVFLDNMDGGSFTSGGWSTAIGSGPWMTGEGKEGSPANDGGLADLYISTDGTHPNAAGVDWLIGMLTTRLQTALAHL